MANTVLSEADLRLTAKAIRGYFGSIEHNARHKGTRVSPGRIAQLERLELIYMELADAMRSNAIRRTRRTQRATDTRPRRKPANRSTTTPHRRVAVSLPHGTPGR